MHNLSAKFSIVSLLVLLISFINRNEIPADLPLLPELNIDPVQRAVNQAPFMTTYNDEQFLVKPRFDYRLNGLVVSYRLHDSENGMMLHALSKDHLNVADFCVVWGDSANPELLQDFDFSNGQFTCNYGSQSRQAWDAFNHHQLSNNHLLAADEFVRDTIKDIQIGDQITLSGWLANYQNPTGYERATSTTRTDTGNGACETIFVNDISIVRPMNSFWRQLMMFSLGAFLISTFLYFTSPYVPNK
ncbi:hypothetical protein ACFODZ_10860 [Marinicella sediminis]|uniref:Uncharacterized protein n=2 Tax=Marinicella sediminis TaxID=1792834 RepID=A0ABV7JET2_9GAMM